MRFLFLSLATLVALAGCHRRPLVRARDGATDASPDAAAGSTGAMTNDDAEAAEGPASDGGGRDTPTREDVDAARADGDATDGVAACGLRIVEVRALDQNGDGVFATPEQATVRVVVENRGAASGPVVVRVTADDPRVLPDGSSESRVSAIASGAREALEVAFAIPKEVWFGSEIGFTITAGLVGDLTCTAPAIEPYVVTTGDRSEGSICDATRQIAISNVRLAGAGAGADRRIEPGADFTFEADLTNPGPLDHNWYPFVRLVSDNPGVTVAGPNGLFALAAGRTNPLSIGLHVAADVPHGTLVHLTASAGAVQVRCRDVPTVDVPVLVQ